MSICEMGQEAMALAFCGQGWRLCPRSLLALSGFLSLHSDLSDHKLALRAQGQGVPSPRGLLRSVQKPFLLLSVLWTLALPAQPLPVISFYGCIWVVNSGPYVSIHRLLFLRVFTSLTSLIHLHNDHHPNSGI